MTAVLGAAVVFLLDRWSKAFMVQYFADNDRGSGVGGRVLSLVYHENHGVIANVPIPWVIIVIATVLVMALILKALFRAIRERRMVAVAALGILIGGALGNLYDRVVQGYVFDWILLLGRSAINIADVGIVVGALGYLAQKNQHNPTVRGPDPRPPTPGSL